MSAPGLTLAGIFPPVTTPFARDESVDFDSLAANLKKYNATKLAGYVILGSTGESVYLRDEEKLKILEAAREAAAPEKILIAGTGAEATAETIELTRRAATLGYRAALVRTPAYFKPQMTEQALERHFLDVAEASPIPLLVYSVPQFTGVAVEAGLAARLGRHPNIVGIKESSGNVGRVAQMVHLSPPGFQVLVGSATTLLPSLAVGVTGAILAVACVLPELCTELYEAYGQGQYARARALQRKLLEPTVAVTSLFGVAGLKFAMDFRGYAGGWPRRPLRPLDEAAKAELLRIFRAFDPSN